MHKLFEIPSFTLFLFALMAIYNASRPSLKWRDTLHASQNTRAIRGKKSALVRVKKSVFVSAQKNTFLCLFVVNKTPFSTSRLRPRPIIIFYTGVNRCRPRLEQLEPLCVHVLFSCVGYWRYAFFFVLPVCYRVCLCVLP